MRLSRLRSAFSLVEVLIVLGMITVLIGMTLPMLGEARRASQRVQCASRLRQHAIAIADYARDFNDMAPYVFAADRGRDWSICLGTDPCVAFPSKVIEEYPPWWMQNAAMTLWDLPLVDLVYGGTTLNSSLNCPADVENISNRDRRRREGLTRSIQTWTRSYQMSGAFVWEPTALDPDHPELLLDMNAMRGQTLGSVVFPSSKILVSEQAPYHDPRFFSRGAVPPHPHLLQFAHLDGSVVMMPSDKLTPGVVPDPTGLMVPDLSTNPLDFTISYPSWGVRGIDHSS